MKEISLGQLRPFVRFARLLDADIKKFPDLLCAGDCRLFYCTGGRGEIRADGKTLGRFDCGVRLVTGETGDILDKVRIE